MSSVLPRALMGAFALIASAAASVSTSTTPPPAPGSQSPLANALLMDGGVGESPDATLMVVVRGERR